jgi:hypothetical protein
MNPEIVYVDFDETLFNHHEYMRWVAGRFKNASDYIATIDKYHEVLSPHHRRYQHDQHTKDMLGVEWHRFSGEIVKAYNEERKRVQKKCLFCYADGHSMLRYLTTKNYDVRILSFGDEGYQRFKMSLCEVIRTLHIPIHVVLQPKRHYFAQHHQEGEYVLIDDKPHLELPKNTTHILIDRAKKHTQDGAGDVVVPSLRVIKEYV